MVLPWTLRGTNIHVDDKNSNSIKIFTPEGTYVRSYGELRDPTGITIEDYSLVAEHEGSSLSIFDPHGYNIHTVCRITVPWCVALDPVSGTLYVASYGANKIFCVIVM